MKYPANEKTRGFHRGFSNGLEKSTRAPPGGVRVTAQGLAAVGKGQAACGFRVV
jgi:hypothetical protein